jgi:ketosteroid isomerase-like protein
VWERDKLESRQLEQARREVTALVTAYYEVGKSKDVAAISSFLAPSNHYTKFDESRPFTRQNANDAFMYEQARFANISDYQYKVEDLRIDVLGFVAVATFYLDYKGVFVNDYSFEGSSVGGKSRVTMVVAKIGEGWKIVHHHASRFPQADKKEG